MKKAIKFLLRCLIYPLGAFLFLILAAVMVILGTPLAVIFALGVAPFATIKWALEDRDCVTWWQCWKDIANDFGK